MARASIQEIRRGEIIDGAIRLVARDGYEAVTMRGLAGELDVSTGTITHWFATKEQILGAALDEVARRMGERLDGMLETVDDPRTVLIAIGDASLPEDEATTAEQRVWLAIAARASRSTALATRHQGHYEGWRRRMEKAVEEGAASGAFRPVDPAAWALGYAALLDGLALHVLLHLEAVTIDGARTVVRTHIDATLLP